MELLIRLLGGAERVKIMRFFLHHEDSVISLNDLSEKTKSKSPLVKKELTALTSLGFIEKKKTRTIVTSTTGKKTLSKLKEVSGYGLNKLFPYNRALKELLFDFHVLDKKELAARFKVIGRIKLFLVAGVFIGDEKSRVDIFIVCEALNRAKAEKIIDSLSAEMGRDVVYSIMDVEEFEYRYKMYDKFVRDILQMDNEVVIDKIKDAKK